MLKREKFNWKYSSVWFLSAEYGERCKENERRKKGGKKGEKEREESVEMCLILRN